MSKVSALVVLAACAGEDTPAEDLGPVEHAIVAPLRTPCVQPAGYFLCEEFAVDGQETETALGGIEGFTQRWGVESEITLRREPATTIGRAEDFILVELIAETLVVTGPFTLTFPPVSGPGQGGWFNSTSQSLGGTQLLCEGTICDEMLTAESQAVEMDGNWSVTLEIVDDRTLRPTAVSCCTALANQ